MPRKPLIVKTHLGQPTCTYAPGQGSLFRTIRKMKARSGTPPGAVLPNVGRLDPGGMEMVDGGTREAPDRAISGPPSDFPRGDDKYGMGWARTPIPWVGP